MCINKYITYTNTYANCINTYANWGCRKNKESNGGRSEKIVKPEPRCSGRRQIKSVTGAIKTVENG